ncbi:PTS sugar transporter subunit IIA [Cytobacillus gottheilii]|uniref:PTS sugar transporter subunit IIA n=1 Tax=Cytobacillus gottheilii TaxID=859144 RepID=UPI0024948073|nr:PTS sugar transporter subunit IIA [Cytobacillus gottheilii]
MNNPIIRIENVKHNLNKMSKSEAITLAGELLVNLGYVTPAYAKSMHERETLTSTYIGNGIGIPHGTEEAKQDILNSGLVVLHFNQPIDYNGEEVRLVIGIAGKGEEHLAILSNIAIALSEEEEVEKVLNFTSREELYAYFNEINNN